MRMTQSYNQEYSLNKETQIKNYRKGIFFFVVRLHEMLRLQIQLVLFFMWQWLRPRHKVFRNVYK